MKAIEKERVLSGLNEIFMRLIEVADREGPLTGGVLAGLAIREYAKAGIALGGLHGSRLGSFDFEDDDDQKGTP